LRTISRFAKAELFDSRETAIQSERANQVSCAQIFAVSPRFARGALQFPGEYLILPDFGGSPPMQ
jgi:hypothetical protein